MYGLVTTAEPDEEPVSLERAKLHLRVDPDDDVEDGLIGGWVAAARRLTEAHTGRRWVTQELTLSLSDWPCDGPVRLPVEPVQSVDAVRYFDAAGVEQEIGEAGYQSWLSHSPPLVAPAPLGVWPVTQAGRLAAAGVDFTAGYGEAADVPESAAAAILLCLGYWYEDRGDGRRRGPDAGIPPGAVRLLSTLSTGAYR